ncbi:hypothetical protein RB195_004812 [Necator americanus]|uniref:Ras-associating domain-containing protein n=1 Tax=Necator americanus TaxID=51031 RepID=A0ABR1BJU3_NECAM
MECFALLNEEGLTSLPEMEKIQERLCSNLIHSKTGFFLWSTSGDQEMGRFQDSGRRRKLFLSIRDGTERILKLLSERPAEGPM